MKVLITGAAGMVAMATAKHCRLAGDEVVALDRRKLDISDRDMVFEIVAAEKPNAVINCAAFTDVDGAEDNEEKCLAVNVRGVENLALASKENDSAFVTISTDYVFDGEKEGFYSQKDTPNPQSVYAKSKLEGERIAAGAYERSIIARTGWIFGYKGTNFLSVMHKLLGEGKEINVISDAFGTPTFADDLGRRLREIAGKDLRGIFHVCNGGTGTSFLGFAEKICEIFGYDKRLLKPVLSRDLERAAARPLNSKLSCLKSEAAELDSLPDWEESLALFLRG